MQINQNIKWLINEVNTDLGNIKLYSYNVSMNSPAVGQYPLSQDYCFWLYNGLIEDYQTITFLVSNMLNINYFSLRPLYCILRSSFEKYADVLNFVVHGSKYLYYVNYLNNMAVGNEQCIVDEQNVKSSFNIAVCNRKTRYYLLGQANKFLGENYPGIADFNRNLADMDSYYSQLLHNNLDVNLVPNYQKIVEILIQLQCMMYATTVLIKEHNQYRDLLNSDLFNKAEYDIMQLESALNDNNIFI